MPSVRAVIVTADIDRLAGFYVEVFGAVEDQRFPAEGDPFFLGFTVGDSAIGLVADDGGGAAPAGRILLSIEVADVDAALDRVNDAGGLVKGPPKDMPWGQRVAHVEDTDGNAINLTA